MPRQGLNGTFSYHDGKVTRTYRFRAGDLGHGVSMVAAEDQARTTRAYYPHRPATQRFSVQVLLKSWEERTHLVNWLVRYAQWALDPNVARTTFPFMTVAVPVRDFRQVGMPLTGFEWGAHTGMMAFTPVFTFEAGVSPGQPSNALKVSSVVNKWSAFGSDPSIQYFYPFGTQLQGGQVPQNYGNVTPPTPVPPPVVPPATGPVVPPTFPGIT